MNNRNQTTVLLASQVAELERLYPGDMVRGYRDGFSGAPWPDKDPSPAYEHGRRNGVNDRGGTVDPEQRMLAADIVGKQRFERVMQREGSSPEGRRRAAAPGAKRVEPDPTNGRGAPSPNLRSEETPS